MRLSGKTAIVTGGATGIGKEYCLALAEEGARVVAADIASTTRVVEEVEARGGKALGFGCDVTNPAEAKALAETAREAFGSIDILVNNAAVFATIQMKPFHRISPEEWDQVLAVNLKGLFLCCQAVYPAMKAGGGGKIINISSGTFFKGIPGFLHYVTSKGGVISFTRALARELGPDKICVNSLAPGFTETRAMRESPTHDPALVEAIVNGRCFKRTELPRDLVGALVFLASAESDFVTGQCLVVDGGSVFN